MTATALHGTPPSTRALGERVALLEAELRAVRVELALLREQSAPTSPRPRLKEG